jgi:hypothetical protein
MVKFNQLVCRGYTDILFVRFFAMDTRISMLQLSVVCCQVADVGVSIQQFTPSARQPTTDIRGFLSW